MNGHGGPPSSADDRPPVDPDVDLHDPQYRGELRGHGAVVLTVISAGGMLGAAGRYGLDVALPTAPAGFPWGTLLVNSTGCLLIGVLMVFVVEVGSVHRLLRPFLGVGVLGGYTTFSTYTADAQTLVAAGRPELALGYLFGTAAVALAAVTAGTVVTRALTPSQGRSAR